jgi:DNA-binding MarR family transcriptional regulator
MSDTTHLLAQHKHDREEAARLRIGLRAYHLLCLVYGNTENRTVSEFAKIMSLSVPALLMHARNLHAAGLIKIRPGRSDRRKKYLHRAQKNIEALLPAPKKGLCV